MKVLQNELDMRLAGFGSSKANNKYLYNGKELEDDFNLNVYHYGARHYDPQLGKWLQVDPADEFHSPYVYCGNDPVNLVDPDGREVNDSNVKRYEAYQAFSSSPEGRFYLSKFEEGGEYENHLLIYYVSDNFKGIANAASAVQETGYFSDGEFIAGQAPKNLQIVHRVVINQSRMCNDIKSPEFLDTSDTFLHETQHAQVDAFFGKPIIKGAEAYISTFSHANKRFMMQKRLSNKYNFNLSDDEINQNVNGFHGFNKAWYDKTKKGNN